MNPLSAPATGPAGDARHHVLLQGIVQGVGLRPWCARLARELGLTGWVCNDGNGVRCEVQGPPHLAQTFLERLRQAPPPLARILRVQIETRPLVTEETSFAIVTSDTQWPPQTGLPPDTSPCDACLQELLTPGDRRYRYPFINCTHCGPRYSVAARLPYDRLHTSLAPFPLCPTCQREYTDPQNRRYHAQASACPACGPQLRLLDAQGQPLAVADPLQAAAQRLRAGQVLAVKSVGGYHLMCDAQQPAPLARLRQAKRRGRKPFALLVPNAASARLWVQLRAADEALLADPRRPILLLPCQPGVAEAYPDIAPGLAEWGVMLPSAPLHWLLIDAARQATAPPPDTPPATAWLTVAHPNQLWIMTSANPGGEPLVADDAEALDRLQGLAEAYLVHDRAILARCDDSIRRPMGRATGVANGSDDPAPPSAAGPTAIHAPFVRRARGHVPEPIELPGVPTDAPSVLATGGWLKATVCLTRRNEAFVSPHLGDLGHPGHCQSLVDQIERLCQFLGVSPQCIAHDRHPDFFSTHHAQALGQAWGVPTLPVQHHHAHAMAVLAESGVHGPALAVVLDGIGLGDDGQLWGGELLQLGTNAAPVAKRLAHWPLLTLPGGDRATQEPWRVATALLLQLGRPAGAQAHYGHEPAMAVLPTQLARGLNCPRTSSAGRLFDAAASLLGLCHRNTHDAEAAMALEAAATRHGPAPAWPEGHVLSDTGQLDFTGLWTHLAASRPCLADEAAARTHATVVAAMADWVRHHALAGPWPTTRPRTLPVALAGGCFINRILRDGLCSALGTDPDLRLLEARLVPCGDGGLSLGQAAVALQHLALASPSQWPSIPPRLNHLHFPASTPCA